MADPLDFSDYDGLITSIGETLNRADLDDQIPGWVVLAEEEHKSDVRIREMIQRVEIEVDDRNIDLPTGFLELKLMRMLEESGGRPWTMEERTAAEMTDLWRSASEPARKLAWGDARPQNLPRYFCINGDIEFEVDPSGYTSLDLPFAELQFYKALTPLSAGNTSNALLVRAPGVYFYGALKHSAPFLLDDERIATWGNAYQAGVTRINTNDRKRGGPQASRVAGPTP